MTTGHDHGQSTLALVGGTGWGSVDPNRTTHKSGYDAYGFYTTANDNHGHNISVRLALPPEVHAQICRLVGDRRFPDYESVQTFLRDAAVHRLHMLSEQNDDDRELREGLQETVQQAAFSEYVDRLQRDAYRWKENINRLKAVFVTLYADGAVHQLRDAIREAEDGVEQTPEPYCTQVRKLCQEWRGELDEGVWSEA